MAGAPLRFTRTSVRLAVTTSGYQIQLYARTTHSMVGWRLLSGNNRESGRAALLYPDAEEARSAIKELQRDLPLLERRIRRAEPNRWTWELHADGVVVATGHPFDRLIRCERALGQFVDEFVAARVGDTVLFTESRRWGSVGTDPLRSGSRSV